MSDYRSLTIRLNEQEREALFRMAQANKRDARDQAAWLIVEALEASGYLYSGTLNAETTRQIVEEINREMREVAQDEKRKAGQSAIDAAGVIVGDRK